MVSQRPRAGAGAASEPQRTDQLTTDPNGLWLKCVEYLPWAQPQAAALSLTDEILPAWVDFVVPGAK